MEKYDVIVVGAGISGMSFAHYAAKANYKTLVLEKSDRIGGTFHSSTLENESSDFWIELGAHTCYNSYRNLIEVIEDCCIDDQITPRAKVPFRVLVSDQVKSFTSQINFLELLVSVPKLFSKRKNGETVASYYGSIVGMNNFKNGHETIHKRLINHSMLFRLFRGPLKNIFYIGEKLLSQRFIGFHKRIIDLVLNL